MNGFLHHVRRGNFRKMPVMKIALLHLLFQVPSLIHFIDVSETNLADL